MPDNFEYKPVRPALRVVAVCLGLFFSATALMLAYFLFQSFSWSLVTKLLVGTILGPFLIYVGITGTNFYAHLDREDDE